MPFAQLAGSVILYATGATGLALLRGHLERRHLPAPSFWYLDHILLPLLRVALLLLFFLLAGESLYGGAVAHDPSADMLPEGRIASLINLLFLLSLLLPLLLREPGLSIPIQAVVLMALIARWQGRKLGLEPVLLPGWGTTVQLLVWMVAGVLLARWLALLAGARLSERLPGLEAVIFDGLQLPAQLPVLLLYGDWLGTQLRP